MLREAKSFLYDLSMACFGSALLGLVMSYIAYLAVRREAMESFWQEGIDLVSALRKISYLDIEEPEELVIEALKDEIDGFCFAKSQTKKGKERLLDWIEVYKFPNNGQEDYDNELKKGYENLIAVYKNKINRIANPYIEYSERNLRGLSNAYGNLDFLIGNKKIRKNAYEGIYRKLCDYRDMCYEESRHFRALNNGCNWATCFRKIRSLNKILYLVEENRVYASYSYEIERELEIFRSKIYGVDPEYEELRPMIERIDFTKPCLKRKKGLEDVKEDTHKSQN